MWCKCIVLVFFPANYLPKFNYWTSRLQQQKIFYVPDAHVYFVGHRNFMIFRLINWSLSFHFKLTTNPPFLKEDRLPGLDNPSHRVLWKYHCFLQVIISGVLWLWINEKCVQKKSLQMCFGRNRYPCLCTAFNMIRYTHHFQAPYWRKKIRNDTWKSISTVKKFYVQHYYNLYFYVIFYLPCCFSWE